MSIIGAEIVGARVLDLFAGSGALGLESLSRGAAVAEFVEISARSLTALRENAATLGAGERAIIHRGEAVKFVSALGAGAFDVAFADPPYRLGLGAAIVERWRAVPFAGLLSVEHAMDEEMPDGGATRRYGSTGITFYRATGDEGGGTGE